MGASDPKAEVAESSPLRVLWIVLPCSPPRGLPGAVVQGTGHGALDRNAVAALVPDGRQCLEPAGDRRARHRVGRGVLPPPGGTGRRRAGRALDDVPPPRSGGTAAAGPGRGGSTCSVTAAMAFVSRPMAMRCRASIPATSACRAAARVRAGHRPHARSRPAGQRWQHAAAQPGAAAGAAGRAVQVAAPAPGGKLRRCNDAPPADQYRGHRAVARPPAARTKQPGCPLASQASGCCGASAMAPWRR